MLLDLLARVRCEHLYLVGDILDFWSLRRDFYWPETHTRVLRSVLEKARGGTPGTDVPGNHDAELRELAGGEFRGIEIRRDCIHVTAAERRLLVMHGDDFDGIVKFPGWLASLGSSVYDVTIAVNRHVNRARRRFGMQYWSLAGYLKTRVGNARRYIDQFEGAAAHSARSHGLDGIVCGHIHRADLWQRDGFIYANLGDWVESCTALVEDRAGFLTLLHWPDTLLAAGEDPGSGARAVHDAVERAVERAA